MNIYQLRINLLTQIPNYKQFEFTSKILVHDSKKQLSTYPFFTDNKLLPKVKLQNMKYDEIVYFFFNKQNFKNVMTSVNTVKTVRNMKELKIKNLKNITRKNKENIVSGSIPVNIRFDNFILMLQLLFPTKFPLMNNIDTSLSYLLTNEIEKIPFQKKNNLDNQINILTMFSKIDNKFIEFLPIQTNQKFSYLNINQNIYTITHVTWINDVMNHPIYREVLLKYNIYEQWRIKYEEKIQQIDQDKKSEIVNYITKLLERKKLKFEKIDRYIDRNNRGFSDFVIFKANYNDNIEILQKIDFNNTTIEQNNTIVKTLISLTNLYYTMQEYRNYAPLFTNFSDIRKKIKDYEIYNDINDSILYLNFEYLNETEEDNTNNYKINEIRNKISKSFSEFNNFVKVIQTMKTRIIDNPYWKKIVTKIVSGESDHNFKELWDEINNCYNILAVAEDENENKLKKIELDEKQKRQEQLINLKKNIKKGGKRSNKCKNNNDALSVGFDFITNESVKKEKIEGNEKEVEENTNIKIIDMYLQMDIIEGKVDEKNMNLLNCPYNDIYLGNMYLNLLYDENETWNIKKRNIFFPGKEILLKKVVDNNAKNVIPVKI